ncbi:MAG TPA: helix-turn-helix transcriptional regulator [Blastocatellia bacterium]
MSKQMFDISNDASLASSDSNSTGNAYSRSSPLSDLVRSHLRSKGMRQVDFCRQTGFDQGLLSKILSSVVTTLNVESALRLADGLGIAPGVVFEAIGKKDIDEMLRRYYSNSHESQAT